MRRIHWKASKPSKAPLEHWVRLGC